MSNSNISNDFDQLFDSVRGIAKKILEINKQAVKQYALIVDDILRSRSSDIAHIEHTLDGLLDFCGYDPALQLYRRLCRYYWDIDSVTTAEYINAYRELWDSEPKQIE